MASPVAELRAAVTKVRETASNATPGPWMVSRIAGVGRSVHDTDLRFSVAVETGWVSGGDAAWIALMSPAVAAPVAVSLEAALASFEEDHKVPVPGPVCDCWERDPILVSALAVARAINGTAP